MIVDFHNHYFPPTYLEAIRRGTSPYRLTEDPDGNPVLHSPGDYNVLVPGYRDLDRRAQVLEQAGIGCQVLTFGAPGTALETPQRAAELAPMINDGLAAAVGAHSGRYAALGHLPLSHPAAALRELDRCVGDLGFRGFMLYGNAGGVPLADDRFRSIYERADRHSLVLFIHPTYPVGVESMEIYMLMPLVGFMFDTSLAAAHLIFAGIPERYPRIRWVLAHLGGAIPYIAERLDRGFEAFPHCQRNLSRPPSEILRSFFYDTVNFDPAALRLALDFAGADQLLAGSDYPHMIGSLDKMLGSLRGLELPAADEAKILGENARRLLGL